jgi:hypothetical protein
MGLERPTQREKRKKKKKRRMRGEKLSGKECCGRTLGVRQLPA